MIAVTPIVRRQCYLAFFAAPRRARRPPSAAPWGEYFCSYSAVGAWTCQVVYATYYLAVNGTFSCVATSPVVGTYPGTYAYTGKSLTLTFAGAGPGNLRSITVDAEQIQDEMLSGQAIYTDNYYGNGYWNWINWNRI